MKDPRASAKALARRKARYTPPRKSRPLPSEPVPRRFGYDDLPARFRGELPSRPRFAVIAGDPERSARFRKRAWAAWFNILTVEQRKRFYQEKRKWYAALSYYEKEKYRAYWRLRDDDRTPEAQKRRRARRAEWYELPFRGGKETVRERRNRLNREYRLANPEKFREIARRNYRLSSPEQKQEAKDWKIAWLKRRRKDPKVNEAHLKGQRVAVRRYRDKIYKDPKAREEFLRKAREGGRVYIKRKLLEDPDHFKRIGREYRARKAKESGIC